VSNATRALAEAILAQDDALDVEDLDSLIQEQIRSMVGSPNEEPEPVNKIQSVYDDPEGDNGAITLSPQEDGSWVLYIPPTQEYHLSEEGTPVLPYGEQGWSNLTAAVASLNIAVKNGDVKFNDGRVAQ